MLPDRSNTTMTSREIGGGGAGTMAARMVLVGKYSRSEQLKLQQGSPFDRTPQIRPAMSNNPEPELPPDTWREEGTVIPEAPLAFTAANPSETRGEIFFTAPLGW